MFEVGHRARDRSWLVVLDSQIVEWGATLGSPWIILKILNGVWNPWIILEIRAAGQTDRYLLSSVVATNSLSPC